MDWRKFNNLKILVIDDDQFTRELIFIMMKKIPDVTIDEAEDGIEALNMIEKDNYDLLLLDLYMPNLNGEKFIQSFNKFKKPLPIVLMTTDRLSNEELKNIGADYYLTKPFDFANFLNSIYKFLEDISNTNEI